MGGRFHRLEACAATVVLIATLALFAPAAAFGDTSAAQSQPSAIERLIRQEDARKAELARYDAAARQNPVTASLDARERATAPPAGDDGFAWGAAALGLAAGIVGACVLLGAVTLLRGQDRLRNA